jgi:hypothetical protein
LSSFRDLTRYEGFVRQLERDTWEHRRGRFRSQQHDDRRKRVSHSLRRLRASQRGCFVLYAEAPSGVVSDADLAESCMAALAATPPTYASYVQSASGEARGEPQSHVLLATCCNAILRWPLQNWHCIWKYQAWCQVRSGTLSMITCA